MRKFLHFSKVSARLCLLVCALCTLAFDSHAQKPKEKFVNDEVLVKFKHASKSESIDTTISSYRAKRLEKLGDLGWQRIKLPPGLSVEKALEKLKLNGLIDAVQPNFYYTILATPNDPIYTDGMYGMASISAPQAWDIATGSPAVVVANIDSGIRYNHEDLAPNIWVNAGETPANGVDDDGNGFVDDVHGYDFRFNDPDPADENGHGTHTAGTIGAVGNNSIGVVGVNWNVKIMAINIYSPAGNDTTSAMLINAYNYVRMMKERGVNIRVTNNSYGGCLEACEYDLATKDAIDALGDAEILNVFAAGNGNTNIDDTPFYPASYSSPSVLSVAASTSTEERAGFSNYGVSGVDLAAPGMHIISTWHTDAFKYNFLSGTSMASPHVAGAAALLSALDPSLSAASLKATIMNNVDILPQWNGLVKTGGRLNVFKALQNQTACDIALESTSILATTKGGLYKLNVTAPPNCEYAVKSDSVWAVVNGPAVASGGGQIAVRVRVNDTLRRSAAIRVGSQIVTVRQSRDGGK
jgi:subtilisin family serine protease